MKFNTKLPKRHFYILVSLLGFIILLLSLEIMMIVKDISLYDKWFNDAFAAGVQLDYNHAYSVYVSTNLASYFQKIIVPMMLGTHAYFAYIKLRINKLFVFIWTVLMLGSLAYIAVELNFGSVFYYLEIVSHVVVVITLISLTYVIDK